MPPLSVLAELSVLLSVAWPPGVAAAAIPGAVGADTVMSAPKSAAKKPLVIHFKVEGMIDGGLAAFVERVVGEAEREKAAALLIEMNTYGGRVDAADVIRTALLEADLLTITFVHTNAASAGALIAIATDTIAMSPGSAIGAATPVDMSGTPASGKVISYFRTLMGETARAKGRDPRIAEAMVDSSVVVPGLEDAPRPLTLRTDQALAFKIAQQEAESISEVLRLNGLEGAEVRRMGVNWAEHVVRFLTNPLVSGLLMTIGALGLIYELTTPGFGVPGIAGIVCLTLFFGSHWIVKLAELTDLLIFLFGAILVVVELFIPGGIVGIIGVVLMVVGLFLTLIGKLEFVTPAHLTDAFISVGTAIVLTFLGAVVLLKGFSQLPGFRRLTLSTRQPPGTGEATATVSSRSQLVGKEGVADTPLRPSGRVIVEGRYLDATADGEHIESGTPVRVVVAGGLRGVVVRPL